MEAQLAGKGAEGRRWAGVLGDEAYDEEGKKMSTTPRMKDDLIARMQALVASLAKECETCHYKTSSRCGSCWGFTAKAIMRDISIDQTPKPTAKVDLRKKVLDYIDAKVFTSYTVISHMTGADYRTVSRIADELVKENLAVRSGNWIKSK